MSSKSKKVNTHACALEIFFLEIYIYIYIFFFRFRCHGVQIQNGHASCRQAHLRPIEKAASPGKKHKQQLSLQFRIISF